MSHKFFKNASGDLLPSRISDSIWNKLKKTAHPIWDISSSNKDVVVTRKREETAQVKFDEIEQYERIPSEGDYAILFMGGRKIQARVLSNFDGLVNMVGNDGYLLDIPQEWVKVADGLGSPSLPTQSQSGPSKGPPDGPQWDKVTIDISNKIRTMMDSSGVARVGVGANSMWDIRTNPDGTVACSILVPDVRTIYQKTHTSLEDFVRKSNPGIGSTSITNILVPG